VAGEDLAGEPGGVEGVVEAGEEHHGQQQQHAGVAQHLHHAHDFFAQRPLLHVDFGAEPEGGRRRRRRRRRWWWGENEVGEELGEKAIKTWRALVIASVEAKANAKRRLTLRRGCAG